jgi:hypothetical protein
MTLSEREWKIMLAAFTTTARDLDRGFETEVVKDGGLAIAVWAELEKGGPLKIGQLCEACKTNWGLERSYQDVEAIAKATGRAVSTERAIFRRRVQ